MMTACLKLWPVSIKNLARANNVPIASVLMNKGYSNYTSSLSHVPLLSGYDEPTTLTYQIRLIGPIGADVRQSTDTLLLTEADPASQERRNILASLGNIARARVSRSARSRQHSKCPNALYRA